MDQREVIVANSDAERLESHISRLPAADEHRRAQGERILGTYIKWLKDLDYKNGR